MDSGHVLPINKLMFIEMGRPEYVSVQGKILYSHLQITIKLSRTVSQVLDRYLSVSHEYTICVESPVQRGIMGYPASAAA